MVSFKPPPPRDKGEGERGIKIQHTMYMHVVTSLSVAVAV